MLHFRHSMRIATTMGVSELQERHVRRPRLFECFLQSRIAPKKAGTIGISGYKRITISFHSQNKQANSLKIVIDPAAGIMYFYSKSYFNGKAGPQGTLQG